MKSFRISEVMLLSNVERKARRLKLDPTLTVIEGPNDTGKSFLLKSILWAFGCQPPQLHDKWRQADVTALVHFSIGKRSFSVLRQGGFHALFEEDDLLGSFSSVTKGLGPQLAELLDFRLKLVDRDQQPVTPPPAFYFLPRYIDQDAGWSEPWASFENLRQFSRWKDPVVDYHTGVLDPERWSLDAQKAQFREKLREAENYTAVLTDLIEEARSGSDGLETRLDAEAFAVELDELLERLEGVRGAQEAVASRLRDLHSDRLTLERQLKVVEASLHEVRQDRDFAIELDGREVECPTCGANYDNAFRQRFAIAADEQRLLRFATELRQELNGLNGEINETATAQEEARAAVDRARELLSAKRGTITLEEFLAAKGRQEVQATLKQRLQAHYEAVHDLTNDLELVEAQLKEIKQAESERRAEVRSEYERLMRAHCSRLNVRTLSASSFEKPTAKIRESGSDLPRALLAYYFAILKLIRDQGEMELGPIVIDSPNQQAQDRFNLLEMLKFIRDEQPEGSQMILALENDLGVEFPGVRHTFSEKYAALRDDAYDGVFRDLEPFLSGALLGEPSEG